MKPLGVATSIVQSELPMETYGVEGRVRRAVNDILLQQGVKYDLTKVSEVLYTCLRYSTSIFEDNSITYALRKQDGMWVCECPDYEKAPFNLCKHRLAVQIHEAMVGA